MLAVEEGIVPEEGKSDGYAIVFSGGGALGAWEVGCYTTIMRRNDNELPVIVTGASAGALNAAGICAGLSCSELENLWCTLRPEEVYSRAFRVRTVLRHLPALTIGLVRRRCLSWAFNRMFAETISLLNTTPLERKLRDTFADHRWQHFFDSDVCFAISLTDLGRREKRIAYKAPADFKPPARRSSEWMRVEDLESLVAVLMGTTALPVLFPPYGNLFDGGILRNQPVGPAIDLGGRLIYILIPQPEGPQQSGNNVVQTTSALLQTWLSMSLDWQIDLTKVRNQIARARPREKPTILCAVRPQSDLTEEYGVGLLSFGQNVDQLIRAGEQDADLRLDNFNHEDEKTWY